MSCRLIEPSEISCYWICTPLCVGVIIQNTNDNKIIQMLSHVYANLYDTYIFAVTALVVDRTTRSGSPMTCERNNNRYATRQYVRIFWIAIDLMGIIKLHVGPEMARVLIDGTWSVRFMDETWCTVLTEWKFVKISVGHKS